MKRTPIGFDAAAAISDVLGVPEGSSWQFAGTPADDTDAAPAVTTISAVESGIDVHAGIDLQVNVPANDILFAAATPTSSTDADIVSIWATPPSQPAETQIVAFGVTVAASLAQEENADQIDTLALQHGSAGLQPASFAPVAFIPAGSANLAPALSASHAVDSFDFGLGADVGAMPQHVDVRAHTLTATAASPAAMALPADFAILANPPPELDEPVTNSQVGSGGATAAQVQQALDESGLSVNGSGIKVGVLSDSFNDLGGAAADEADRALPPASDIQVLKDLSSGGTDEGRAMMQIIHDIAPGADLAFYTAFDSEQDFANGILALAAAGSKVIVDDVSYFDEPFFQNGIVAQAIQTVEAEGVTYVTAAGNEASNAYQAVWTPIAHTSYDGSLLSDIESFGGSPVQTVTVGGNVPLILEWNQPYGGAKSDLEILAFQNGNLVGESGDREASSNNPWAGIELSAGTYQIAIENLSGPNPGLIKEITLGDGIPVTIGGANVGTVYGHAMTPGAITAGAVSAAGTPAFGDNAPTSESFSSSGVGTELLFANNGTALLSPDELSPVAVSGVDDIRTTVPGGLSDFYGTSAASASLAGVAALILSADPNLTPAQVELIMEQTALTMANSAVSGAGLVQVDPAIAAVEALYAPVVTATNQTVAYHQSIPITELFSISNSSGITEYQVWFSDPQAGAPALGTVTENGTPIGLNQTVTVSSLSGVDYTGSATAGTDEIWLRVYDGAWSGWTQANITDPGVPPPVVTATNQTVAYDQSIPITDLFSVSGSGITEYKIWFSDPQAGAPALGTVTENGTPIGLNQTVTVSSLSGVVYTGSATAGTDEIWLQAYDGVWSGWVQANITDPGAVTATNQTVAYHQSIPITELFSISNSSGITEYQVWFSDPQAGAPALGTVTENGTPIGLNQTVTVSSLSGVDYTGSATAGTDEIWLRVYDGAWSGWTQANITDPGVPPPVVTATNQTVAYDQSIPITDLFSVSGSGITEYKIWFSDPQAGAPALGTVTENGTPIGLNQTVTVSSLSGVDYTGSATAGTDEIWLQAYDGVWSGWVQANITDPGAVTATNQTVAYHQSIPITELFSISNSSGITEYQVWFSDPQAGAPALGTVTENGTPIGLNQTVTVSSLSGVDYTGSATAGTDEIWLRVYDGAWSGWTQANITDLGNQPSGSGLAASTAGDVPPTSVSNSAPSLLTVLAGASLELAGATSASITFATSTGMLKLDQPSTFTGEIFGFTGNGSLSGSDQIDLKGINDSTVHDSYANGVLTVTDGTNTAHLSFNGSYVLGNFELASDGSGGTIVYDPPVPNSSVSGTSAAVATDHGNDTFVFHPNMGANGTNHTSETNAVLFDHAAFDVPALTATHDLHETLIAVNAAHDWITFHASVAAQQPHHGFLV